MEPLDKIKLAALVLFTGMCLTCQAQNQIVKTNRTEYHMDNRVQEDSDLIKEYLPYKKQMDAQMNSVIGQCAKELTKSYDLPETLLGDFFSDAVLAQSKRIDPDIDFAMPSTKGGLRSELAKGNIHLFDIFELMPFENETVVLTLKGTDVRQLLNAIAAAGGEPVAGIKMDISNKIPRHIFINGRAFDPAKTYKVLTSDYVANGGDHIAGLQNPLKKAVLGLKIRDALIAYIKTQTAGNKIINAQLDGRITKTDRRQFIKTGGMALAAITLSTSALDTFAAGELRKLTILHTNDVHSHIEPFPMDGSRNQGLGGVARRAGLIKKIRAAANNVLLLDAGDIFQGTPYFNLFGGELEMKLMSEMAYDASAIGNHDFDNGIDGFYKQLPNANFPILVSNYDFSDTVMHSSTSPYKIFNKAGIKVGVFGLGIELDGLVEKKNYKETRYLDPVAKGNEMASLLRNEHNCDLVICLSHLGYQYKENKVSDQILAKNTRNIDLIIGGHTHTFMDQPEDVVNLDGNITTINQVGWAGINLGRIDYTFKPGAKQHAKSAQQYQIANHLDGANL